MGFYKDFLWGASSAAFQIEGAWNKDGKGLSIWDTLGREPGRIARGETGEVACDHYHRFREDVALMREMGLKSYRFSVSWPRVLPQGTGAVNEAGIRFYEQLVDALLDANITPILTLYHWDMPHALYEKGGWRNPESSEWFAQYASVVANRLGTRVPYWCTFNEPQMFMGLGYQIGIHAPFEHASESDMLCMTKNILLAHGKAIKVLREILGSGAKLGIAPTGDCHLPENDTSEALEAARAKSFSLDGNYIMSNTWWADPIFLGKLPEGAVERFGEKMFSFTEEEWALVSQKLDFYAFNVYQAFVTLPLPTDRYDEYGYQGCPKTMCGWNVTPDVLYWAPKFFHERYGLPVLITENGMAAMDWISLDGHVHDMQRIDFLHRYLLALRRTADDGIPVLGYTCWSLLDNCEWASGYDQRYGLIYVDFATQARTIKDSGRWYHDVIAANGANL